MPNADLLMQGDPCGLWKRFYFTLAAILGLVHISLVTDFLQVPLAGAAKATSIQNILLILKENMFN